MRNRYESVVGDVKTETPFATEFAPELRAYGFAFDVNSPFRARVDGRYREYVVQVLTAAKPVPFEATCLELDPIANRYLIPQLQFLSRTHPLTFAKPFKRNGDEGTYDAVYIIKLLERLLQEEGIDPPRDTLAAALTIFLSRNNRMPSSFLSRRAATKPTDRILRRSLGECFTYLADGRHEDPRVQALFDEAIPVDIILRAADGINPSLLREFG